MTAAAQAAGPDLGEAYLVACARHGYLDACELLVRRHSAMAYRVALRLTGDHHDAQDIAQEALIAAWENLARFRAGSSFSTWLYQIVTRRALNKVTRGRAAGSLDTLSDLAGPGGEPAVQAERNLTAEAVTGALHALPFPQRAVIVLHHFEGLSYAEVASVTGSTEAAVRSHLFRARRALGESCRNGGEQPGERPAARRPGRPATAERGHRAVRRRRRPAAGAGRRRPRHRPGHPPAALRALPGRPR